MPSDGSTMPETQLRERQDRLVRHLTTEQNTNRLRALSDEPEAVQRRLEQLRNA